MIIFGHIFFIIFSSFCYSQTNISIDHLDNSYSFIPLTLESHRKTVFFLDQNFPNVTHDIEYLNFKIDGSMNYPLYNSIPKRIFLSSSDTLTMSQLSFLQDHSEYFYDTSVALKSYLRKDVNLLTQFESKSRKRYIYDESQQTKGVNYDQKLIASIYKSNEKSLIDAGYMYHYEQIPTYIKLSDYPNNPFFRSLESYNFKLHYSYSGDRLSFKNKGNLQIATYSRPLDLSDLHILEYLTQTNWNRMIINYSISKKYTFNFNSDYKLILSDVPDNLFSFSNHYHRLSLGFSLEDKINEFRFGIDRFNKNSNCHYFDYILNLNKFTFFMSTQNNIYINMNYSNATYSLDKFISKNEYIGFKFKNTAINTSLILGHHNIKNYTYFYYRLDNNLTYKWIALNLSYNLYDTNELFLKSHIELSIKVSPKIDNKRYRPYAKIKFNNLSINNSYKISQAQLNAYSRDTSGEKGSRGLSITDLEAGVVFNYFKIAFIYENYYNKPFVYGYNFGSDESQEEYFSVYNQSDYLIEITWIFKD